MLAMWYNMLRYKLSNNKVFEISTNWTHYKNNWVRHNILLFLDIIIARTKIPFLRKELLALW